ncbi:alpha/beta fold hydrolase [Sphingomonas glacialis]|uniref:Alpha/beta hydrolase n=1 Tax=Sphingomonas glacialis TaxID=658225 RepID=A0A502FT97_9SPHN|nr:alpha/beta hydrolase [Sphingomonas glacialis]TPG52630.1 alpha/beta hydrolase [Sphingomonas glacialis]
MTLVPIPAPSTTRRRVLVGVTGLAVAGAIGIPSYALSSAAPSRSPARHGAGEGAIKTQDGTPIFYRDWGDGPVVVLSHGWPLNSDAWQDQLFFLASNGCRVIAHDRRGHGRSGQSWVGNDIDHYADDLAAVMDGLDLQGVTLVGHSTGGGEISRYIGRHGTVRLSKAVLVSAIPPIRLRTPTNPNGAPLSAFDDTRQKVLADRAQFYHDLSAPFFGTNRPGVVVSQGVREAFWQQCMAAGLKAVHDGIKAQSETDFTPDLRRFDVPTLIIHGEQDQLVPVGNSAVLQRELIRGAALKIYAGAPHGLPVTHRERFNADLLAFVRA